MTIPHPKPSPGNPYVFIILMFPSTDEDRMFQWHPHHVVTREHDLFLLLFPFNLSHITYPLAPSQIHALSLFKLLIDLLKYIKYNLFSP